MSEPVARAGASHRPSGETPAQRQARLRTLAALQRDALGARWGRLSPTLERGDAVLARLRRLRQHPVALALLAASASGLLVSRRGRRVVGALRTGWKLGLRAATVFSLWRATRGATGGSGLYRRGEARRQALRDAAAPRALADARSAAPDAPSPPPAGAPGRPA